jgi:hypothetical protein
MIQINTLTFSYNKREDRIFFFINHSDFRNRIDFIVTRLKLIELLNGFDDILINYCDGGKLFKDLYKTQEPLNQEKTISSDEDKDKNNNKNRWEKKVTNTDLKFTQNKEPLILDAISYNIKDKNIVFKYISSKKVYAISHIDFDMFQKTLSSMMRVIPFVSWGISPHILD